MLVGPLPSALVRCARSDWRRALFDDDERLRWSPADEDIAADLFDLTQEMFSSEGGFTVSLTLNGRTMEINMTQEDLENL